MIDKHMNQINPFDLRQLLQDWDDLDVTEYYLACVLGLMPYDAEFRQFRKAKHVFWTTNPTSEMLVKIIDLLCKNNWLETTDDGQYRWNNSKVGDWDVSQM